VTSVVNERRPAVLLVEDNDTIRGAFAILLEECGYAVLQAREGREALRIAGSGTADLILMDLGLPDLNGLEVTRRLKADDRTRHIPVVALTGRALESDVEACRAAGCSGYFAKPVNASELLGALPGFLGTAQ
jgi:two-component system, cell cycle response regulator DivK